MIDTAELMPVESIKEHVIADAQKKPGSTSEVKMMLELPSAPEFNFAANGYWAALDIIREQRALAQQLAQALDDIERNFTADEKTKTAWVWVSEEYAYKSFEKSQAALDAARKAGVLQ